MYTRSYPSESERVAPPVNYDGFTFQDSDSYEKNCTRPPTNQETAPKSELCEEECVSTNTTPKSPLGGILGFGKGLFGGLLGSPFKLPKLGNEEILIIATALFLIFSKEGDKECAVLLLLLLLIN